MFDNLQLVLFRLMHTLAYTIMPEHPTLASFQPSSHVPSGKAMLMLRS
jgi:hypothetical protein